MLTTSSSHPVLPSLIQTPLLSTHQTTAPSREQPTAYAHKSSKERYYPKAQPNVGANHVKSNSWSQFWQGLWLAQVLLTTAIFCLKSVLPPRAHYDMGRSLIWVSGICALTLTSTRQQSEFNQLRLPLVGQIKPCKQQARTSLCRQHGTVTQQKHYSSGRTAHWTMGLCSSFLLSSFCGLMAIIASIFIIH